MSRRRTSAWSGLAIGGASLLSCVGEPLKRQVGHLHMKTMNALHRTFVLWPLRLMAVTLIVLVFTFWFVTPSKVFVGAAVIFGVIHSLSTMEELTGGRELAFVTVPLILAGDAFLTLLGFNGMTFFQKIILYLQFLALVVLSESIIVLTLRSRLQAFCGRRN